MTEKELIAKEAERDILDPDRVLRREAFALAMKKMFTRFIYVNPQLYRALLRMNINIIGKSINQDRDFCIYTKNYHVPVKGPWEFWVKPKIGKAIAVLAEESPQFMFPKNQKFIKYDSKQGILRIKGVSFALGKTSWKYEFCELIFKDQKSRKESIALWLLTTKISALKTTESKAESALRKRFVRFNKQIYNNVGIEEFWEIRKNSVGINTIYL